MRQTSLLIAALFCLACLNLDICAQQANEPAKVEVGAHFTSLTGQQIQSQFFGEQARSRTGLGARFSYNLTKHVAFEAEGNFSPFPEFGLGFGALMVQGQFGIKAGKRFEKFGIFAKARPGFLSVDDMLVQTGTTTITGNNGQPVAVPVIDDKRQNFFTLDVGGVLEFYPSRRFLIRFDAGDTIINTGDARTVSFVLPQFHAPLPRTTHSFQFSSGIAFRFLNPEPAPDYTSSGSVAERKFEAGAQFSSLRLRFFSQPQLPQLGFDGIDVQSGIGGRLAYNFNSAIAAEVQTDFYPADMHTFANGRGGGRILQVQGGAKLGKRFERFGVFGKMRPGAVSFSKAVRFDMSSSPFRPFLEIERRTYFSMDIGGVFEFYPSPRIVVRFDGGDTMIRYGRTQVPTNTMSMPVEHIPSETRHQFQFSTGVGFRF